MDPLLVKLALTGLIVLGCIGLFFGIGLALAAKKFAVKQDPKVVEVLETFAGAQCGACGYAGCEGYAEAVVHDPEVLPNHCFPGRYEVAKAVAKITGKEIKEIQDLDATVRCSKVEGKVQKKYDYLGFKTCAAAALAFGGPMACPYACIAFGDCARACPFNAIVMVDELPVIDPMACVGCGTCVRSCPKKIIELIPLQARVWVPCSTRDPGKVVKKLCQTGCLACKKCVKACPAKAIAIDDNLVKIEYARCIEYGPSCGEICVKECPRNILRLYQPQCKVGRQTEPAPQACLE